MNENARTTGIARAWRSSLSIVLLPPRAADWAFPQRSSRPAVHLRAWLL